MRCYGAQTEAVKMEKIGSRSEKYYGSDCLEVGGEGEGGMRADLNPSVRNCAEADASH